jgi:twitching motility protein PilT
MTNEMMVSMVSGVAIETADALSQENKKTKDSVEIEKDDHILSIDELVSKGKKYKATDIHMVAGLPAKFRINGTLVSGTSYVLTPELCTAYAREIVGPEEFDETAGEIDAAKTFANNRCRINIFKQQGKHSIALRILAEDIPDIFTLGLPDVVEKFITMNKGIILVTGETGSGKSTSLAAIINGINKQRAVHIVTLEEPIEYIYTPDRAVINQREVGTDTESFSTGIRAVLREDPNVILFGEMRDKESIEMAITAAETGHLVFATLHTNSAADSVDRIVSTFPPESQNLARVRISSALHAILSQQLLPKKGGGRILAYELMVVNSPIAALIREGKTEQLLNTMQMNQNIGCTTMDDCLYKLFKDGKITESTCLEAAHNPNGLKARIHNK